MLEEGFHGSPGSVVCLYLQNFHAGSLPKKDICSSPLFCPCCVWVAVHLHLKREVFKAKWNGFELAEFGSVKTTTCKDVGSGCNVPQELERETFLGVLATFIVKKLNYPGNSIFPGLWV